ncbi:hypothetical protein [Pseudonocardia nigra]|uniref:hypothetical protein n=1 Tax=Pseudonocardia nigra TaxID=1921578 RepID=UPI001C5EB86F|nr:hypothetical protein [Pseudonocardia nigra]
MRLPPWHTVHPAQQWMAWHLMQEELQRQQREARYSTGPEMDRLRAQIAQLEREAEQH